MTLDTPHQTLKERQRQERAALILQAAEAVFAEKGYHDTSMDEIAVRVGVAKGTVYQHFSSKEELVFALFEREWEAAQSMVEQAVVMETSARARLETILQHTYQGLLGKRMHLLMSLYQSLDIRHGVLAQRLKMRNRMDRLAAAIRTIVEEGKAAGEFNPEISTVVMLTTFFSMLSPRAYEWLAGNEQISPEELVRQVGSVYFQGICPTLRQKD